MTGATNGRIGTVARAARRIVPALAALALALTLTACDSCGDFPWQNNRPGSCHGAPPPN